MHTHTLLFGGKNENHCLADLFDLYKENERQSCLSASVTMSLESELYIACNKSHPHNRGVLLKIKRPLVNMCLGSDTQEKVTVNRKGNSNPIFRQIINDNVE